MVAIGERRRPDPRGRPGYLGVDTVHQGDTQTRKGLYHINAVDTLTQWQIVGCCETISEAHLLPVLEAILHQFPFRIRGFHSDNGSEFLNKRVAALLNKLLVAEFTKSRAYRTTDNALVEGKNGAVVRKHIGHEPIGAQHAAELQRFLHGLFQPLFEPPSPLRVCHHRAGRQRTPAAPLSARRLPHTLRKSCFSLDQWETHLKEGISAAALEQQNAALQRHRMRPAHAGRQEKAPGRVPLAVVSSSDRHAAPPAGRAAEPGLRSPSGLPAARLGAARGTNEKLRVSNSQEPALHNPAPPTTKERSSTRFHTLFRPSLDQPHFRIILGLENA